MSNTVHPMFPFSAIVGQDAMKLALLLNAIEPSIGGVLVTGTRGTAKSTAVRALADVLPQILVRRGDPFHGEPAPQEMGDAAAIPTPFVDLPVGATEDRVLGTLDIEKALKHGEKHFEPGLLARAHRGVLYIDEVNLLPDHLVDVILDAAAMGVNRVEREGISFTHEARVILVGTMNPEEGELRPQLLDRFGLCVAVEPLSDVVIRKEAMLRRIAFDADPAAFVHAYEREQNAVAERIVNARRLLPRVTAGNAVLDRIVQLAADAGADGLRADLALHRSVRAFAAWQGRDAATLEDLETVAELALAHRRRRERQPAPASPPSLPPPKPGNHSGDRGNSPQGSSPKETLHGFGQPRLMPWQENADRKASGRRKVSPGRGRGSDRSSFGAARVTALATRSIAVADTVRAAATRRPGSPLLPIDVRDCKWRSRRQKPRRLVVFVVDASGSMAAASRMRAAKSAALGLLEKAYRTRSSVALIVFRNQSAEVLLAPTRSAFRAFQKLRQLPSGGQTPLAEGLQTATELIHRALEKDPGVRPFLILITDGRATPPAEGFAAALERAAQLGDRDIAALCIDVESGPVRLRQTAALARALKANYVKTDELPSTTWAPIIEEWLSWK